MQRHQLFSPRSRRRYSRRVDFLCNVARAPIRTCEGALALSEEFIRRSPRPFRESTCLARVFAENGPDTVEGTHSCPRVDALRSTARWGSFCREGRRNRRRVKGLRRARRRGSRSRPREKVAFLSSNRHISRSVSLCRDLVDSVRGSACLLLPDRRPRSIESGRIVTLRGATVRFGASTMFNRGGPSLEP